MSDISVITCPGCGAIITIDWANHNYAYDEPECNVSSADDLIYAAEYEFGETEGDGANGYE